MIELPLMPEYEYDYSKYSQSELNNIFIFYCALNDLNIIKNIMNSPNMKIFPDMHSQNDKAFKHLIENSNIKIIDYLIFECNMAKTIEIENFLENSDSKNKDAINNKFMIREVNQDLKIELVKNEIKSKKNKV